MKNAIVKSISNYEIKYKGELIIEYNNIDEFKEDILKVVGEKLTLLEIIGHYKSELTNRDNLTEEQKEELKELVLELEGFEFWEGCLKDPNYPL